jgi:hypothetical protein
MSGKPTKILCDVPAESPPSPLRHWLILPPELRKWGQALLHQQCWCWGQDIKRREGNLLLEHGFTRTRAPEGHRGSPTYHKSQAESGHSSTSSTASMPRSITLWGFGLCYAEPERGSVFLSRSGFVPRYSPSARLSRQAWKAEHLGEFTAPRRAHECLESLRLLCAALRWLAEYEAQVLHEHSAHYRTSTLRQWDSHAVLPAQEMPAEWLRLSELCQRKACICTRDANGIQRALAHEFAIAHSTPRSIQ